MANWLSAAETQQILAHLPPIATTADDKQAFAMRPGSLPPPRTGQTVHTAFPPAATPPPVNAGDNGPLEVLRHAPDGDVHLVPQISVTFSQPMVPLTALGDLEARQVPVQLTPQPPGHWRWLGTRTLVFDGTPRFPMATSYDVTVKAGTTSALKGTLGQAVTWHFDTPPPAIEQSYPSGNAQPLNPHFFVSFDQDVNAQAVLATTKLVANGQNVGITLLTDSEGRGRHPAQAVRNAGAQEALAGVPRRRALHPGTTYVVEIGPGTPSLEGPRTTTQMPVV